MGNRMKTATGWLQYFDHVGYSDHEDLNRFAAYLEIVEWNPDRDDGINDMAERELEHFIGEYDNPVEYAEQIAWEAYKYELEAMPGWISNHIDFSEVWRCELSFDCFTADTPLGNVWIWHIH